MNPKPQKMEEKTNKPVNVLVGRFQPFTRIDLGTAQGMSISNGLPVVLVYIRSHQVYENTPLKSETVRCMLNDLKSLDLFEDVLYSDTWEQEDILKKVSKSGYTGMLVKKSNHDDVQSQLARLAVRMNDQKIFCRCVPEQLGKYFDRFKSDMLESTKQ